MATPSRRPIHRSSSTSNRSSCIDDLKGNLPSTPSTHSRYMPDFAPRGPSHDGLIPYSDHPHHPGFHRSAPASHTSSPSGSRPVPGYPPFPDNWQRPHHTPPSAHSHEPRFSPHHMAFDADLANRRHSLIPNYLPMHSYPPIHATAMPPHGPPMGVFPEASHSAFDEMSSPSGRARAHNFVPATPASLFGAPHASHHQRHVGAPAYTASSGSVAHRQSGTRKDHSFSDRSKTLSKNAGLRSSAQAAKPLQSSPPLATVKKTPRDSKRRATHSQIERRRREKINDRLITLRNLVPACVKEIEDRARAKLEDEQHAERVAAGLAPSTTVQKGKRKRIRKKSGASDAKDKDADKEPELGLHKLEVLTHTIDYIYDLQARIEELETGVRPARIRRAEDNEDDLMEDADGEDQSRVRHASCGTSMKEDEDETQSVQRSDAGMKKEPSDLIADVTKEGNKDDEEDEIADDDEEMDIELSAPPYKRRNSNMAHSHAPGPQEARDAASSMDQRRSSISAMSTTSETSSELSAGAPDTSPYHELSPLFAPTHTASSSLSSLTSPFMSLSATSPIFMNGKQIGTAGFPHGTSSANPSLSKFALPPGALSTLESADTGETSSRRRSRAGSSAAGSNLVLASRSRSQHGSVSAIRGDSKEDFDEGGNSLATQGDSELTGTAGDDRSAAELLLAFSGSPEDALKPVGSSSKSKTRLVRRSTTTSSNGIRMPAFSTPQMRPIGSSSSTPQRTVTNVQHSQLPLSLPAKHVEAAHTLRKIPGSAPGGSMATVTEGGRDALPSPPPLELAPADASSEHQSDKR